MGVEMKWGEVRLGETVDIGRKVAILKRVGIALKWTGVMMVGYGFVVVIVVFGPLIKANLKFEILNFKSNPNTTISKQNEFKPSWEVPDRDYSIYIPKIGAVARVIPGVDAGDKKAYLVALKRGVAEARGLAHPGQKGTTFLFAHSAAPVDFARYNAVFYLLDKLGEGDRVEIVYKNKLFKYKVMTREILEAKNTKYLVNSGKEVLVLQTCWPPGTTWKRLVLTAKPVMVY